jgi:hypothetical protein
MHVLGSNRPPRITLPACNICKVGGVQSWLANTHLGSSIHLAEVGKGKCPPCFTDATLLELGTLGLAKVGLHHSYSILWAHHSLAQDCP